MCVDYSKGPVHMGSQVPSPESPLMLASPNVEAKSQRFSPKKPLK